MTAPALLLLLLALAFPSDGAALRRSQFTRYRSWNTRRYPVWRDGDPRFRNCWFGGEVTFDLKGDGPTLTGASTTFTINLNFPPNQTALSDGQVVWERNCTINGQQYEEGQAVYPDQGTAQTGLFPDGTPFTRSQARKPRYVFVWKTLGRYWQVADGPSSSLTIGTDNVPLGSYNMEVVIYHCRGTDKFVPLGYASSVFTVTDQVPFTISLAQINDINQDDQNFIQNRAIAFSVKLHDPSQYLGNADISFSWDFGDSSGTLISRERTVTHTYLAVGTFKPQVVLMASVPAGCDNPTAVAPAVASAAPAVVVIDPSAAAPAEAGEAVEVAPVAPEGVDTAVVAEETDAATDAAAADAAAADTDAADAAAADTDAAAADAAAADTDAAAADAAAADTDAAAADAVAVEAADADAAVDLAAAETDAAADVAEADAAVADAAAADAAAADVAAADVTAADAATVDTEADVAAADAAAADVAAADAADAADVAAADAADAAAAEEPVVEADAAEEIAPVVDAAASVAPVAEVVEVAAIVTVAPVAGEEAVEQEAEVVAADVAVVDAAATAEVVPAETAAPAENAIVPVATEATVVEEAAPVDAAVADLEAEVQETENEVAATVAAAEQPAVEEEGEVQAEAVADPAQVPLVVAKRQAPELGADCMIYRYGSLATSVDVVQGIESVEIVEVSNVVALTTELDQNAVDITISCQGSLPSEVCTVISDADCITPVETVCNAATPSPDCQMILRQFFNETGVFCLNVSLTNGVSLAVASARVSVSVASGGSPAGTAATVLGVMVLACVVCCIGLMYRRFKQYQPLTEDSSSGSVVTSVPLLLWNLLSRQSPGESRPLLQGRVV